MEEIHTAGDHGGPWSKRGECLFYSVLGILGVYVRGQHCNRSHKNGLNPHLNQ